MPKIHVKCGSHVINGVISSPDATSYANEYIKPRSSETLALLPLYLMFAVDEERQVTTSLRTVSPQSDKHLCYLLRVVRDRHSCFF